VPVFPDNRRRTDSVALLHSRTPTRATLSYCPLSPLPACSDTTRMRATNQGVDLDRRDILHSRCLIRASLRLLRPSPIPNRELSAVCSSMRFVARNPSQTSEEPSRALISDTNSPQPTTFLPGTARKAEVTEKKPLKNPLYPEPELHIRVAQFHTECQAQFQTECASPDVLEQGKIPLNIRIEKELS